MLGFYWDKTVQRWQESMGLEKRAGSLKDFEMGNELGSPGVDALTTRRRKSFFILIFQLDFE